MLKDRKELNILRQCTGLKRISYATTDKKLYIMKLTHYYYLLTYSVALVRMRTIPTERPQLFGEVSANLYYYYLLLLLTALVV
jgi:hypothetical protein